MWFDIMADSSIVKGPYHKLKEIRMLQKMQGKDARSKKVKEIAKKLIEKDAWHAHTEHLLISLLYSDDESDRQFAIEKIVELRNSRDIGNKSVRPFSTPKLNWNATSLRDIQDWSDLSEPLNTTTIPTADLRQFLANFWPILGQSSQAP